MAGWRELICGGVEKKTLYCGFIAFDFIFYIFFLKLKNIHKNMKSNTKNTGIKVFSIPPRHIDQSKRG